VAIASAGELDEFDHNTFFEAKGTGETAQFKNKNDVQKWLHIIRSSHAPKTVEHPKTGTRPPFPFSDVRLLPYLQHRSGSYPTLPPATRWRTCSPRSTTPFGTATRSSAAGASAGIGVEALRAGTQAVLIEGIDNSATGLEPWANGLSY
jgi:hypothetical protein